MTNRTKLKLVGFFAALLLVGVAFVAAPSIHSVPSFSDDPDQLVLFSIDPTYRRKELGNLSPEQEKAEKIHGYLLLGKTEIADPAKRREIMSAIRTSMRFAPALAARCFNPRHVVRLSKGTETVDLLLCFECLQYELFRDGDEGSRKWGKLGSHSQPLLDKTLTEAGVQVAPK